MLISLGPLHVCFSSMSALETDVLLRLQRLHAFPLFSNLTGIFLALFEQMLKQLHPSSTLTNSQAGKFSTLVVRFDCPNDSEPCRKGATRDPTSLPPGRG